MGDRSTGREQVAAEAERLLVTAERLSQRRGGVQIEDAALRGISLVQLERLNRIASVQCARDGWASAVTSDTLGADALDVYDLLQHLIGPATSERGCSLVELIADDASAQAPRFYVSHWFGLPLHQLLKCLRTHAADHKLEPARTFYWLAFAALRPDEVAASRGPDAPAELEAHPFHRALRACESMLCLVDTGGLSLGRLWPLLELRLALAGRGGGFGLDIYAPVPGRWDAPAVGLVDGVPRSDKAVMAKQLREHYFPRALVECARAVSVSRAEASELAERLRLRAAVAEHEASVDKAIGARFSAARLPLLLERGTHTGANPIEVGRELARTLEAVADAALPSLTVLCVRPPRPAVVSKLGSALPAAHALEALNLKALGAPVIPGVVRLLGADDCALQHLDLRANQLDAQCGTELAEALRSNRTLRTLRVGDNKLGEGGHAICEALRSNYSLRLLAIDRNGLTSECGEMLGRSLRHNSSLTEIDISHNELGEFGGTGVAMGLCLNSCVAKLDIGSNQLGHKVEEELRSAWQWQLIGKQPPQGARPVRPIGLHI